MALKYEILTCFSFSSVSIEAPAEYCCPGRIAMSGKIISVEIFCFPYFHYFDLSPNDFHFVSISKSETKIKPVESSLSGIFTDSRFYTSILSIFLKLMQKMTY